MHVAQRLCTARAACPAPGRPFRMRRMRVPGRMLFHAALATFAVLSFVFPPNASRAVELLSGDLVVTDLGSGGSGSAQLDRIDPETGSRVTLPASAGNPRKRPLGARTQFCLSTKMAK